MIKPDWSVFKTKFSENPQHNFEWLCYILFCKEFNKPLGVFRYKNQASIETATIEIDGEVIGWQAKFYEDSLSKNKGRLIRTIESARSDYPEISKIIFYTNQEWGQNKGKDPKSKNDIEERAKQLNVRIEWRPASFFESPFVAIENETIARHFFSLDKSVVDQVDKQRRHTEIVLSEIKTGITFRDQIIEFDRSKILEQIRTSPQIMIISGSGGVGKTAVIKELYEDSKNTYPFYVFKATEFELRNINDLLGDFSFLDFVNVHKDQPNVTVVVDSAEKILDLKNLNFFSYKKIILTKW